MIDRSRKANSDCRYLEVLLLGSLEEFADGFCKFFSKFLFGFWRFDLDVLQNFEVAVEKHETCLRPADVDSDRYRLRSVCFIFFRHRMIPCKPPVRGNPNHSVPARLRPIGGNDPRNY